MIAHCDIDAFYASVELLRHPELRGRPLVVAGTGPRSVVTTASYEARRFGIDSAMPASRARALCPQAVFIAPDHAAYREKSREVWELVRAHAEQIQQVGIDEAYLDVTELELPMRTLRELVAQVRESTGMTMSVGIGPSRLVAKTVSASFKPNAFTALSREDACTRFAGAPTRILQGIGPKTADRLAAIGVRTVGELQRHADALLIEHFGARAARELKARSWFHDASPVAPVGAAKSRSNETTFPRDVVDPGEIEAVIERLARDLCLTLGQRDLAGRTIAIKVRLDDWTTVTRARSLPQRTRDPELVTATALELLRAYAPARPVRLLGVRVAGFDAPTRGDPSAQLARPL